ncbi:MAG: ATP-dependent sacrificial sulfur transferase LarE [Desulfobacterales bacterium]|nr:ATP-dependent sacrificial sulfur transferase LarE [Desulfobacterales bacterium]
MNKNSLETKKTDLIKILEGYKSLAVAFSGGVDSTLLLSVAQTALGDNVIAVTSKSLVHPVREIGRTSEFANENGIRHIVFKSKEMDDNAFLNNTRDRCYICKKMLFDKITEIASDNSINHIAHGANVDDLNDYRPGFKAAGERGVAAPLIDANLSKADIRELSKEMGLKTWNKPAMACLATRIPYGSPITIEKIKMIENAEMILMDQGFAVCRVRHHGEIARIELLPEDISKIMNEPIRTIVFEKIKALGFSFVSLDLEGYLQGSMNRTL